MSVGIRAIHDAIASLAAATGYFTTVNKHEPKNAPGSRLSASVFLGPDDMESVEGSGLSSTSVRVTFTVQARCNMISKPEDGIDAELGEAVDAVMSAISGNFDLDSAGVRAVDLLGMYGEGMRAKWGYIEHGDKHYRAADIIVPVIVNDAWTQVT